jgi:hypothetical protein
MARAINPKTRSKRRIASILLAIRSTILGSCKSCVADACSSTPPADITGEAHQLESVRVEDNRTTLASTINESGAFSILYEKAPDDAGAFVFK